MLTSDIIDELFSILGPKGLYTQEEDISSFFTDFRHRYTGNAQAVLLPASAAEASAAMNIVTRQSVPIYLQGGNTGLCYGAVPDDGVLIVLRRMRKVRNVDAYSRLLTVDAGMTLTEVHHEAEKLGLQFPLYLGSEGSAQIGGLIATNAGGTGVLRYGSMRDLVIGIEMILPDGQILDELLGLRKNNTGYSLTDLVAGSEGTLGLITGAVLRLYPQMKSHSHAFLGLSSPEAAIEVGSRLQDVFGEKVEALELLDKNAASYVKRHIPDARMPLPFLPEYCLLVEVSAPRAGIELTMDLQNNLAELMDEELIQEAIVSQNERQAQEIWHFRHSVTEANKINGVGVVIDASVRPSVIAKFIKIANQAVLDNFPEAESAIVSHLADGNVHYIVMFPHDVWGEFTDKNAKELEVEEIVHDVIISLGGSFSAEHGVGRKLTSEMERCIDPVRLELMRGIKAVFDPAGLMNPGVLLKR